MDSRQKGFSILEIILVGMVIGLLGVVAWFFVNNQQKANDNNPTPQASSKQTVSSEDTKARPSTNSWYTYTPSARQYSISIADGWTLHKKTDGDTSLYSTGSLASQPGTQSSVVDTVADIPQCDVLILDFLDNVLQDDNLYAHSVTTASGLKMETSVTTDDLGISGGGLTYSYSGFRNKHSVNITYTTCKNGVDNHDVVEQVVKTLSIN